MRGVRLLACMMLINAAAIAEQLSNAEQLMSEVSALLAKGTPDKKVARRIEEAHLTDSLTDRLTEDLRKKYRVGPYTMFALDMQAHESLYLMPPADTIPADPNPGTEEMSLMRDHLKQYVDDSMTSWSKFVAKTAKTLFANQKNGYSSPPEKIWYPHEPYPFRTPELPESVNTPIGQFGYLQGAIFRWLHWDACSDHKVAVFEFTEGPDSPFRRAARQMGSKETRHHGLVSFFPEDGTVCWLVVTGSYDHSHLNHTQTIASTVVTVFGPVEIDGHRYWFPTKTVVMTRTEQTGLCLRNMMVATEYHKVDAQSTVTYSPPRAQ